MAGVLKSIANAVRFVASATVGIPLAVAGTLVVGTAAAVVTGMNFCWSHAIQKNKWSKELLFDQGLNKAQQSLWGAVKGIWTQFGVYAYVQTAKQISGHAQSELTYRGALEPQHPNSYNVEPRTHSLHAVKEYGDYGTGEQPSNKITQAEADRLWEQQQQRE